MDAVLDLLYFSHHHDNDAKIFNNRLGILRLILLIVLILSMNNNKWELHFSFHLTAIHFSIKMEKPAWN